MIGLHSFWRTDALWDCVKIGACSIFWRMRKIACVFTHAIWTVLLNNVCCIYFCRRMRKSHANIRSEKIATHPIWTGPKTPRTTKELKWRLALSIKSQMFNLYTSSFDIFRGIFRKIVCHVGRIDQFAVYGGGGKTPAVFGGAIATSSYFGGRRTYKIKYNESNVPWCYKR